MEVNPRWQIICNAKPAPDWVSAFSSRLSKKGINCLLIQPGQFNPDIPAVNLSDQNFATNTRIIRPQINAKESSAHTNISEIRIIETTPATEKFLLTTWFSRFRNAEILDLQISYMIEKCCLQEFNDIPDKPKTENTAGISFYDRYLTSNDWSLAIIDTPLQEIALNDKNYTPELLFPFRKNVIRADVFGINKNGTDYILFEQQLKEEKGKIVLLKNGKTEIISDSNLHLSYPFTFLDKGDFYVIPEQHESGRTDLYILDEATEKLKFHNTILPDFAASDPTLIQYQDRYWLFATNSDDHGENTRLHIFYSDSLDGEWKPHALNPVKISSYGARPAGRLFFHNGQLYRPAQDNLANYGGAVIIYQVTDLSPEKYAEKQVSYLSPARFGQDYKGIHTISALGNRTLIDLKRKSFSLRNILGLIRKR